MRMFHWSREDLSDEKAQAPEKYRKHGDRGNGGWTTKRSFDGLVRRLLHAMMTQDTFTVVSKYTATSSAFQTISLMCAKVILTVKTSLSRNKRSGWS